jgi:hypothetical protein
VSAEEALKKFMNKHGREFVTVEVSFVYSNELKKHTNEVQYQVFSSSNCCCMPAASIALAVENALNCKPVKECCGDFAGG